MVGPRKFVPTKHPKPWQESRPRDDFLRAADMADAGCLHRTIAAAFGVSRQRASVMVAKGRKMIAAGDAWVER